MIQRCTDPHSADYPDYGGRGVTICEEWQGPHGFERFLSEMGRRPQGRSLDRVDVDAPYCRSNCRWASPQEQQLNKRGTAFREITAFGETKSRAEWAVLSGIKANEIRRRLRVGWTPERAISAPLRELPSRRAQA